MVWARRSSLTPGDFGLGQVLRKDFGDPGDQGWPRSPRGTKFPAPGMPVGSGLSSSAPSSLGSGPVNWLGSITLRFTPLRPSTRATAATMPRIGSAPCRSAMTASTGSSSHPGGSPQKAQDHTVRRPGWVIRRRDPRAAVRRRDRRAESRAVPGLLSSGVGLSASLGPHLTGHPGARGRFSGRGGG